jgi:hypothetical protein
MSTQTQTKEKKMENRMRKVAGMFSLTVMSVAVPSVGYSYGYGYSKPVEESNCSDSVIQKNLAALKDLNIVKVDGLAPFACYGYCFTSNDAKVIAEDKCEKAEALAKAVQLLQPLKVNEKP